MDGVVKERTLHVLWSQIGVLSSLETEMENSRDHEEHAEGEREWESGGGAGHTKRHVHGHTPDARSGADAWPACRRRTQGRPARWEAGRRHDQSRWWDTAGGGLLAALPPDPPPRPARTLAPALGLSLSPLRMGLPLLRLHPRA